MIKIRKKPATKTWKREVFGYVVMVKAKPACTSVKAYCVAALKRKYAAVRVTFKWRGAFDKGNKI